MTCFVWLGQVEPKLNMDKSTITDPVKGEVYCSVLHISYCLSCRSLHPIPEGGHD